MGRIYFFFIFSFNLEYRKFFFQLQRKKKKTFGGIGPFLKENGDHIDETEAELLRETYEKAFSTPKEQEKVTDPKEFFTEEPDAISISTIPMTTDDLKEAISALSANAAPGSDGIPAVMLKKCMNSIIEPLDILWTKSMCSGKIPEIFKTAYITPVQQEVILSCDRDMLERIHRQVNSHHTGL